jgi:hypothetical protein
VIALVVSTLGGEIKGLVMKVRTTISTGMVLLAGYLGTFWEKMPKENFFLLMFALAFAAGLAFFALLKPLKKAIG